MKQVLIVEDEPWLADVYRRALTVADLQVTLVQDAQKAIDAIDASQPDVILLDMLLPNGNGMQLLHELRSHVDLAAIPVILCTSIANNLPTTELRAYGVVQILDKARIRPKDVVQTVKEVLAR